jgi:hypothetical protein
MNSIKTYMALILTLVMTLISFGCSTKENDFARKKWEYNKKVMSGLGGNDTTVHGVTLLPIKKK